MGIFAQDFKDAVIHPTLTQIDQWSPATEALLLGTAAIMSNLGSTLHTEQDNRQYGIYLTDKKTHRKVWDEYLAFDCDLASKVRGFASQRLFLVDPEQELVTNLAYATAIAWATYRISTKNLPQDPTNLPALAQCWFDHYPHPNINLAQQEKTIEYFVTNMQLMNQMPPGQPLLVA